jgi:hypothetical protein
VADMLYGIGIAMALLTGGIIGLILTVTHHQRLTAQRERYEQEVARDRELRAAAAQAAHQRYNRPIWPGNLGRSAGLRARRDRRTIILAWC